MIDEQVLQRYLDGELDARTRQLIETQLARDAELRARLAALRSIEQQYGGLDRSTFPSQARTALIERLRQEASPMSYDFIHDDDLTQLRELHSATWPIWSLYLDLSPERRQQAPLRLRFKTLARAAEEHSDIQQRPTVARAAFAEDQARIDAFLASAPEIEGRGLAIFCSSELGLWRVFRLPVAVTDRLEIADRPYLRPLLTLIDEFERYLVVLIDAGTARFTDVFMGAIEDVTALTTHVQPASGDWVEWTTHRHDEQLRRHARSVVARIEARWQEQSYDWLVIGGTEEARGALRQELPKTLQERLAGELPLSPQIELPRVLERVLQIEREHEQRIEAERVETLITTALKGGPAVLGLDDTLQAVMEERVQILLVEDGFTQPGWTCAYCRSLGVRSEPACPVCGASLSTVEDVVDVALERTLEQRGAIEILRGDARAELARHGHIGALLRYEV